MKKYSQKDLTLFLISLAAFSLIFQAGSYRTWASRLPLGASRDFFLSVFEPLTDQMNTVGANAPVQFLSQQFSAVSGLTVDAGFMAADSVPLIVDTAAVDSITPLPAVHFSKSRPLRVLLIGDSMMGEGPGPQFKKLVDHDTAITAAMYFEYSSGLTRLDFFNWHKQATAIFEKDSFDIAIVFIGANDAQDLLDTGGRCVFGTETWPSKYAERVKVFLAILRQNTMRVFWLGMPPMRTPAYQKKMTVLNTVFEQECNKHADAEYLSTVPILGDAAGNFSSYAALGGSQVKIRAGDGIHLTNDGGKILAEFVLERLLRNFPAR